LLISANSSVISAAALPGTRVVLCEQVFADMIFERADMVIRTFEEATTRHGRPERVMTDIEGLSKELSVSRASEYEGNKQWTGLLQGFAWGIAADDSGTQRGEFIHPDLWAEMIKPHYRKLCDWIHRNTKWKTFFHCCGSVYHLIPHFIEAGIVGPAHGYSDAHRAGR
jgi:hypothetical protein